MLFCRLNLVSRRESLPRSASRDTLPFQRSGEVSYTVHVLDHLEERGLRQVSLRMLSNRIERLKCRHLIKLRGWHENGRLSQFRRLFLFRFIHRSFLLCQGWISHVVPLCPLHLVFNLICDVFPHECLAFKLCKLLRIDPEKRALETDALQLKLVLPRGQVFFATHRSWSIQSQSLYEGHVFDFAKPRN